MPRSNQPGTISGLNRAMEQRHDPQQPGSSDEWMGVIPLIPVENPGIDPNPVIRLFSRMEEAAAEREICDILDDINIEIAQIRMAPDEKSLRALLPSVERLCRRSGRLGLLGLSRVAADVAFCLERHDQAALHATVSRLIRVADRSMVEIWNGTELG